MTRTFDPTDVVITLRRLIREAWALYRWDTRPDLSACVSQ
jgi:hypothetical protein